MLYPFPIGSDSGFKKVSILDLACCGKIKLYVNGTAIITITSADIIY